VNKKWNLSLPTVCTLTAITFAATAITAQTSTPERVALVPYRAFIKLRVPPVPRFWGPGT